MARYALSSKHGPTIAEVASRPRNVDVADANSMVRRVLRLKLRRPPAAIRSKAQREGISLKLVNRSPYNRRAN
jgi:hypothetical protein